MTETMVLATAAALVKIATDEGNPNGMKETKATISAMQAVHSVVLGAPAKNTFELLCYAPDFIGWSIIRQAAGGVSFEEATSPGKNPVSFFTEHAEATVREYTRSILSKAPPSTALFIFMLNDIVEFSCMTESPDKILETVGLKLDASDSENMQSIVNWMCNTAGISAFDLSTQPDPTQPPDLFNLELDLTQPPDWNGVLG